LIEQTNKGQNDMITSQVYSAAKEMRGTFSALNVQDFINNGLALKQVKGALNNLSKNTRIVKINSNWYRWQS